MKDRKSPDGKKLFSSPSFLASLLLIVLGITYYVSLSHLNDISSWLTRIFNIFTPFIGGLALAFLLSPLACRFETKVLKKGRPRTRRCLAVTLTYLLLLVVITLLLYIILPQMYTSITTLIERIPGYLAGLKTAVTELAGHFKLLDTQNTSFIVDTYSELIGKLTAWLQTLLPHLVDASFSIGSGIMNLLMAVIASIYILADKERLKRITKKLLFALLPAPHDQKVVSILQRSGIIFSSFIDGKILDSLIIGLLCFIGTTIMHMPYAGLISLIVGVTNIIPFFGPFIGAAPSVLILLMVEPWSALWFTIFIIALQQLDGNVIGPRILSESIGVSALGVLVSITVAGKLWGLMGMIVGVPIYAVLTILVREYVQARLNKKAVRACSADDEPTETQDSAVLDETPCDAAAKEAGRP